VWTDGLNAQVSFSARPPKSDIALFITSDPFVVEDKLPSQELHVFVNFLRVGFSLVREYGELNFNIPKYVFHSQTTIIDFYLPKACSPRSLNRGSDLRQLGLAVSRLMLAEI
jgi:hypothetical protein